MVSHALEEDGEYWGKVLYTIYVEGSEKARLTRRILALALSH